MKGDFTVLTEKTRPLTNYAVTFVKTLPSWEYLKPGVWLSNHLIQAFFEILNKRITEPNKFWFVSPMLCIHLNSASSRCARFSTRSNFNIVELEKMFLPVWVSRKHFALIVVDMKLQKVFVFDSKQGRKRVQIQPGHWCLEIVQKIKVYINDEIKRNKMDADNVQAFENVLEWEVMFGPNAPQQGESGCDCAVYVCKVAEFMNNGISLSHILASDMTYYRMRLAIEIFIHQGDLH
jgi:Ulp1 family protease